MSKQSKNENVEATETAKPKMKSLVSGAKFHDFETDAIFEGIWTGDEVKAEQDNEQRQQKKGDLMGYRFVGEDDQDVLIGASHAVSKAIGMVEPGTKLRIEFLGKDTSGPKPFNRFKIDAYEN